jgi:hypothetical protein
MAGKRKVKECGVAATPRRPRGAALHSAVSQVGNLRGVRLVGPGTFTRRGRRHARPAASRRHGRLQTCVTRLAASHGAAPGCGPPSTPRRPKFRGRPCARTPPRSARGAPNGAGAGAVPKIRRPRGTGGPPVGHPPRRGARPCGEGRPHAPAAAPRGNSQWTGWQPVPHPRGTGLQPVRHLPHGGAANPWLRRPRRPAPAGCRRRLAARIPWRTEHSGLESPPSSRGGAPRAPSATGASPPRRRQDGIIGTCGLGFGAFPALSLELCPLSFEFPARVARLRAPSGRPRGGAAD